MRSTRRTFLQTGAAATGVLLVGFRLPVNEHAADQASAFEPNAFIRVDVDGTITMTVPRPEMGQGVRTSLAMILAEELEAEWEQVQVEQADFDAQYGPQYVGGSNSIRTSWRPLREAGATARAMLVAAAATRWNVAGDTCYASNGRVHHRPSGRNLGFGDLTQAAASQPQPEVIELKDANAFRIIGQRKRNVDGPSIVTGDISFGIDVAVPGMVYAVIQRSSVFGARPASVDDRGARAVPGVLDVVAVDADVVGPLPPNNPRVAHGIAVIAQSTWAAIQGRDALTVSWETDSTDPESSDRFWRACEQSAGRAPERLLRDDGAVDRALSNGAHRLRSVYRVPYLTHAPMEPLNCLAHVESDRCRIWASTQNPANVLDVAQRITGLPADAITIHPQRMGGSFGRRFYGDDAAEAIYLSKALGTPVKLMWTREDDIRNGAYRPAGYHVMEGALDAQGLPTAWSHHLVNASRYTALGRLDRPPGAGELYEHDFPAHMIDNFRLAYSSVASKVPRGQWRGIADSANVFVVQSFIDEMAHLARRDPLAYRLDVLGPPRALPHYHTGRLRRVVELAAERFGWDTPLPDGHGRGLAFSFANSAYVAHAVELSGDPSGSTLTVHRVVSAVDIGHVVNPAGVEAQIEGSVAQGLSAALFEQISIADGATEQSNLDDYRVLRMREMPTVEIHIVESEDPPMGIGEGALPPIAPAVANALFDATGARIRTLPVGEQAIVPR